MEEDILFRTGDKMFSYRVGGILVQNDKILLQRPQNDDYSVIGGHVGWMETGAEALKREFAEEIGVPVQVGELIAVGEIFFHWGKRPCHQIALYYHVRLERESIPIEGMFFGKERDDMMFCWVPLDDLKDGVKMYPAELVPHLIQPAKEPVHFMSRQLCT